MGENPNWPEPNQLAIYLQAWSRIWTRNYREQIRLAVRKNNNIQSRKEGRSHGWEDNRSALFTIYMYINMWIVLKLGRQHTKAPPAAALSPFMSLLFPANPWCDCCAKVGHSTGVYVHYSFRKVVWVLLRRSHKIQISVCAVRRDLRFFVLIRED